MSLKFGNGSSLGLEQVFVPKKRSDDSPGHSFQHLRPKETRFIISLKRKLTPRVLLKPKFKLNIAHHKTSYKPDLKLPVRVTDRFTIEPGYKFKWSHYSGVDKDDKRKREPFIALVYRMGVFKLELRRTQIWAGHKMYNDRRRDYENKLKLKYALTANFTLFADARDVTASSTDSRRQLKSKLGFEYAF